MCVTSPVWTKSLPPMNNYKERKTATSQLEQSVVALAVLGNVLCEMLMLL